MSVGDKVLLFLEGLTELQQAKPILLGPETINFYPTTDGYLQNYPGKEDYFDRDKGDSGLTDGWGTPPLLTVSWSKIFSFFDYLHVEHLVAVGDNKLYEIIGNGVVELYEFKGRQVNGICFPTMFVHESKLIILNEGDEPLLWDGVDGVTPLGVSEIPPAPIIVSVYNPMTKTIPAPDPYTAGNIWYHWRDGYLNGAGTEREDAAATLIWGVYKVVAQFVDKYGNHGKASPPSPSVGTQPKHATDDWDSISAQMIWEPPSKNEHIHYVRTGRTLTLNDDDAAPLGDASIFFTEYLVEGTTLHRRWLRIKDSALASRTLIDMDVHGPPSAVFGFSFANRIWLYSEGVWQYSDLVLFGQFRASQQVVPLTESVVGLPAGDRAFIIGERSTEVWYESAAGPALLEQDTENGSRHGTSFVAVGDGVIFGLWNFGFGFYDGKTHKPVATPYYIEKYYVNSLSSNFNSAVKIGDWYYLPVQKDNESANNNVILMFNFHTGKWYIVADFVRDIGFWNEEIVGVSNSIYVLYRGGTYPVSIISTAGIVADNVNRQRTVSDLRLLMEPSSLNTISLSVFGEERASEELGTGTAMPIDSVNRINPITYPFWSKVDENYGVDWQTPGDAWLQITHAKPVSGFYHKVKATFPAGHLVRIKGIELTYSNHFRPEGR